MKLLTCLFFVFFSCSLYSQIGWSEKACLKAYSKQLSKVEYGKYSSVVYRLDNNLLIQYTFYKDKAIMIAIKIKNGKFDNKLAFKVRDSLVNEKIKWSQDKTRKYYYTSEKYSFLMNHEKLLTLSLNELPKTFDNAIPHLNNGN